MPESEPDRSVSPAGPRWVSWLIALACGALALAFVVPLAIRGIILSDEGYLLLQSLDMLEGKVLYRDMDAFVTPGAWFVLAALFSVVEPSVLHSRIPIVIAYLALWGVSYRIAAGQGGRGYGLAVLVLIAVFTLWAFPFWTFTFYSPLSVLCALGALERLLSWGQERRPRTLLVVGLALGAAVLFKQNYGVFAAAGIALGLLVLRIDEDGAPLWRARTWGRDLAWVTLGGLMIGGPTLLYFGWNGALGHVYQSLFLHPFEFMGQHDIPYLAFSDLFSDRPIGGGIERLTYAAPNAYTIATPARWVRETAAIERMHVLLYWYPAALFALAGFFSVWRAGRLSIDPPLLAVLAVAGLVFLGVFPRADYNHLANVYQPVLVLSAVVAGRVAARAERPSWWRRGALALAVAVVAAFGLISVYWYQVLMVRFATPVPGPRGGVKVDFMDANHMNYHVRQIHRRSKPGEALLTVPDLAMYNFLADRPMPSPFYNLYQHHIGHDGGRSVVEGAKANDTRVALARFENFFSDRVGLREYAPALASYLRNDFDIAYTGFGDSLLFLERAEQPRSDRETIELLPLCEAQDDQVIKIRRHLLFGSLYHEGHGGRGLQRGPLETRCSVRVPEEGATLVLQLGHRPPAGASSRARLLATILERDIDSREHELLRETVPIISAPRPIPKAPDRIPVRVDLSEYAGREIELVFRSRLLGKIRQTPVNIRAFAMVWQDPHLEGGRAP